MHALCCFDLGSEQKEYLLCFSKFAIYVNYEGERSRQSEIMWPSEVDLTVLITFYHLSIAEIHMLSPSSR